jgi:alkylation response protein AidB-like acyl-CoA dehydrogenase
MDFSYSAEQDMLRESVERLLSAQYDFHTRQMIVRSDGGKTSAIWAELRDLGLVQLPFDAAHGGLDGSIVDMVAVAEIFGKFLVVEPLLTSVMLAGRMLAACADHPEAAAWTSRIASGSARAAFAHDEGHGTPDPSHVGLKVKREGADYILTGEKRLVIGAEGADRLVVTGRLSGAPGDGAGIGMFLVDPLSPSVEITPVRMFDGRRAAHVRLDRCSAILIEAESFATVDRLINDTLVVLSAEVVGAIGALVEQTAEYASTRKQFGAPIASFQAVAHRLADMKIAHVKARATMLHTAARAEAGLITQRDVSIMKAQTATLGRSVGEAAVQLHGGIGMTDELAIGHYLKHILAFDAMFGDADFHWRRIGAEA